MFLWLKLLAFGLALVDADDFSTVPTASTTLTDGKSSLFPAPGPSFIPSHSTPSSPASIPEANPGSASNETMFPTYQTSNAKEMSVSQAVPTSPATPASIAITEPVPTSNSSSLPHKDSHSSSIQTFSSTAAHPSLSPSTAMHAPPDGRDDSTMHHISSSTDTPTSISQAPADTTSGSIAIDTTPLDCNHVNISVNRNFYNGSAELKITQSSMLRNVTCTEAHCIWKKENRNVLTGLQECKVYNIVVTYVAGCTKSKSIRIPPNTTTWKLGEPQKRNTSVTLIWDNHNDKECNLRYDYCCHQQGEDCNSGKRKYLSRSSSNSGTVEKLSPNKNYTCISCISFYDEELKKVTIKIKTDYGRPGKPENVMNITNATTIKINWKKPQTEENGPIDGYMVQKCKDNCECNKDGEPIDVLKNTSHSWSTLKPYTWYKVCVWAYTNTEANGRLKGDENSQVIRTEPAQPSPVKDLNASLSEEANNIVNIKCTKPNEINGPKKVYRLNWEGYEIKNDKCEFEVKDLSYLTTYNFKVTFSNGYADSESVQTDITTRYNSRALIIFLAFLIIVTSLALLIVLYKIYTLNKKKSRDSDEPMLPVVRGWYSAFDDDRHLLNIDPIPAELLWEAYKRKIADEGRLFLDEFQSIPRVFSKFTIKDARKSYNQNKNRYVDILPYDYNRVELSAIPGDPGSDYINASHIDGFTEPRKYIAAQGPKDETTDDFWKMIWEQKATVVVMVTRCEEGNRVKCAKYWPSMEEESASYGDIVVKINECKVCPDYIIQKLHITNRREKTTGRDVTHIQFTSWPDHGVPDNPHLLLKLRRRVNALSNFFSGPIVVHCSAGVGRTGTYIGIDAMLEGLEAEGRVDVYGFVVKLRRQRCLMVQVESQYILIHQALVEYIQFGETEVSISELHSHLSNLKKRDPPSDPTLLETEFQRLPSYRNWQTQRAANKEENKSKNRSSAVIPYDYNRVLFKTEEEGSRESEHDSNDEESDEESDCEEPNKYINASYVTGYWLQNAVIATQGPLPETISDFWNMVYQRKVKVIVMLTELKDDTQELCAQYWGEGKQTYDGITVELKDVSHCSSYTIRAFDVTHAKRKETRKVFQYQYHKWKAFILPESPKGLVALIQNLKEKLPPPDVTAEANARGRNVPIVVHCCDGSQQTGVFCALLNLLESAETEGVIDVFQVVKSLRRARPGMISSFEDYQFLYDAVASEFPAQNGQLQKTQCQEHKVNIHNYEKEEEPNSVTIDFYYPVQETGNEVERHEDSKAKDGSREVKNSSNGPTNPVSTEIV
ncbi:receptor-type tyrosine-protein phosphatase C isoform X2 [Rhineura floridana]|uniref:receptor-type tyrosine-protein phosphatase C isoform X2 n=1 Tax=Rhineura floridana TaxID=261503 RepID=UPI002AC89438|nr:receptor-type tyrosine-protein phosphatase C isoform X2 [Rhineura floridana]